MERLCERVLLLTLWVKELIFALIWILRIRRLISKNFRESTEKVFSSLAAKILLTLDFNSLDKLSKAVKKLHSRPFGEFCLFVALNLLASKGHTFHESLKCFQENLVRNHCYYKSNLFVVYHRTYYLFPVLNKSIL